MTTKANEATTTETVTTTPTETKAPSVPATKAVKTKRNKRNLAANKAAPKAGKANKPTKAPAVTTETKTTDKKDKISAAQRSAINTQKTIDAGATAFVQASGRDDAYLAFYHSLNAGKPFKLPEAAEKRTNPFYSGSNKAHDAGAINRAIKAGNLSYNKANGNYLLTKAGKQLAAAQFNKLTKS